MLYLYPVVVCLVVLFCLALTVHCGLKMASEMGDPYFIRVLPKVLPCELLLFLTMVGGTVATAWWSGSALFPMNDPLWFPVIAFPSCQFCFWVITLFIMDEGAPSVEGELIGWVVSFRRVAYYRGSRRRFIGLRRWLGFEHFISGLRVIHHRAEGPNGRRLEVTVVIKATPATGMDVFVATFPAFRETIVSTVDIAIQLGGTGDEIATRLRWLLFDRRQLELEWQKVRLYLPPVELAVQP